MKKRRRTFQGYQLHNIDGIVAEIRRLERCKHAHDLYPLNILQSEDLRAKIGFGTAQNEPSRVWWYKERIRFADYQSEQFEPRRRRIPWPAWRGRWRGPRSSPSGSSPSWRSRRSRRTWTPPGWRRTWWPCREPLLRRRSTWVREVQRTYRAKAAAAGARHTLLCLETSLRNCYEN